MAGWRGGGDRGRHHRLADRLALPDRDLRRGGDRRHLCRPPLLAAAGRGKGDINDPTPRIVGQQGEATDAFKAGLGRVFVDGKEWAAELEGGGELAAKTKVEVTQILGGARLKVKAE